MLKPRIKNGVFVDITSSYPAVMHGNDMPVTLKGFKMFAEARWYGKEVPPEEDGNMERVDACLIDNIANTSLCYVSRFVFPASCNMPTIPVRFEDSTVNVR